LQIFKHDTLIKGQPAQIDCAEIQGQRYSISRGPVTVVNLEEEWYEDVRDPAGVIDLLTDDRVLKADLFTFRQRLPDLEPKYDFPIEWESIAALPIQTFDHWFNKQVKGTTRNMIRKSQKAGVEVRECGYDDAFVSGMTEIFNEAPVRQGRRFWHYGKDLETIKQQFSRYLFREYLLGAFCGDEMVGFVMLANAGRFGILGQFISKMQHRNKAINNTLMAKTVETCANRQLPYLVYGDWSVTSLSDFKRHSGFVEVSLPRYFVPLTQKGKLVLKAGLHRGLKAALPSRIKDPLKKLRKLWYEFRTD
jgi:hypothetical protein